MVFDNRKTAAILNSRQGLRPIGSDEWVQRSRDAVRDAVSKGYTLLTSVGMNSWEMVLFLASRYKAPREVFIPDAKDEDANRKKELLSRQFRLDNSLTKWKPVASGDNRRSDDSFQQLRDRLIVQGANVIYPVSIRKGGNLDGLIHEAYRKGAGVDDTFTTQYREHLYRCRIEIDPERIDPAADRALESCVIHWTKASSNAWPGETMYEYYRDIFDAASRYPRSGLDTLIRILSEGRIRGSSKHYRKNLCAVAFSSLKPSEAVRLMKWRARYREMTFEPYGIAIRKSYGEMTGIRKVFYGNPDMYRYLDESDRPYFQSIGVKGYWMPEKEFRHVGDIDLNLIPKESLVVIVWKKEEIAEVKRLFDGEVISLYA